MENVQVSKTVCFHCGEPLPSQGVEFFSINSVSQPMCCSGCKAVAQAILSAGLSDYYIHRKELPNKIDESSLLQTSDWQAFDKLNVETTISENQNEVMLDIEGLHCVSCSWLVQNKLESESDVTVVSLDHQTGIAVVRWDKNKKPLSSILHTINTLGYLPHVLDQEDGELDKELSSQHSENSLKRLVVAGLGMMQVMMFAVALYTGDEQNMQMVYRRFLIWVSMLVTFPVLFYAGMPFLRHAWQSIRLKRMHMDIPIAIALLSAFSLSVLNSFMGSGEVYFDSVVMFVFFLSISRYIQEQVTRRMISSRQAFARMLPVLVDVEIDGKTVKKPVAEIKLGDTIAIPLGSIIPADGVIISGNTEIDASSLSGESKALVFGQGDKVFAGMRNLGQPFSMSVTANTKQSAISVLSQRLKRSQFTTDQDKSFVAQYVTIFIAFTLLLAISVFAYWYLQGEWQYGFEIALAVLVVSCPCALSIAMPSSVASLTKYLHELGLYVINPNKLFNLTRIDTVIFDKTGTLTTPFSELQVDVNETDAELLLQYARALSQYTQHPKARFLQDPQQTVQSDIVVSDVHDLVGSGVSGVINGKRYYLGKTSFVVNTSEDDISVKKAEDMDKKNSNSVTSDICFGDGTNCLLRWIQTEQIRLGARKLIDNLQHDGFELLISSGDQNSMVKVMADVLHISQFYAEQSSSQKYEFLKELQAEGKKVLCIGDGINDAEFLQQADLSISFTDASELAQAQADILIAGNDLSRIEALFLSANKLKTIYTQNLTWAIAYNLIMVPLAVLGFIQPWIAALGMSISSLFVVLNSLRLSKIQKKIIPIPMVEANAL